MNHGSLFNGIGGFQLAAKQMGWNNIFSCEIDNFCNQVTQKHYPNCIQYEDIRNTNFTIHRGTIDVLTGGFPCQDISNAKTHTSNKKYEQNGITGKRSGLWFEMLRAIKEIKPAFVVAENVSSLTHKGLHTVLLCLSEIGYNAEWATLPASQFGAPHQRERIWIVAYPNSYGRKQESIILSQIINKKIRETPEWQLSRTICQTYGKKTLPQYCGIHDGVPLELHHAKRIAAIGNAIVPQIAFEIFKAIVSAKYNQ
jgi:DNA (cytosine-5)-methyltransferase 1